MAVAPVGLHGPKNVNSPLMHCLIFVYRIGIRVTYCESDVELLSWKTSSYSFWISCWTHVYVWTRWKAVDLSGAVHMTNTSQLTRETITCFTRETNRVRSLVFSTWTALDKCRCLRREDRHENSMDYSHVSCMCNHRGNFPCFTWEVYRDPLDVSSEPILRILSRISTSCSTRDTKHVDIPWTRL